MTYVPTYATQADCEAYTEGLVVRDTAAFARLLERAERDVDALFIPRVPLASTGLRLDPRLLQGWEAAALSRAVCAQVEWRLTIGEDALAGTPADAPVASVEGPDFKKTYAVKQIDSTAVTAESRYGPKVAGEIMALSHLRILTARV